LTQLLIYDFVVQQNFEVRLIELSIKNLNCYKKWKIKKLYLCSLKIMDINNKKIQG